MLNDNTLAFKKKEKREERVGESLIYQKKKNFFLLISI